jgi:Zn-dependent protease with chaperone function
MSGTIDYGAVRPSPEEVRLSTGDKMLEPFTTHPNMLKRIQHLSTLKV